MDWKDFHKLAVQLSSSKIESEQRSAISRAYYALFHLSKECFTAHGGQIPRPRSGNSHAIVWQTLQSHNDSNWKNIARTGDRLKQYRRKADYDKNVKSLSVILRQAILQSTQCISVLDEHYP